MKEMVEEWSTIKISWNAMKDAYALYGKNYPDAKFHEEKYSIFSDLFKEMYTDVKKRFMHEDTLALDSHKQAAIITISCLKSGAIEHNVDGNEQISILPQLVAVVTGLSYMKDRLNDLLSEKNIKKKIEKYYLPVAIACDTPYLEIMSRLLYYEEHEEDMQFNVMELSEKYFLVEYINLLQYGIEPYMLK